MCYVLQKAELDEVLDRTGTFTLFAPSNQAFEKLGEETVEKLLEDPTGELQDILKYHVSDIMYFEDDLFCERKIDTLKGDSSDDFSTTKCDENGQKFQFGNGNPTGSWSRIVAKDIVTCNGVVHVVDKVILPKSN